MGLERVSQEIKSNIIPEEGIDFDPHFVRQAFVDNVFIRVLAHLVGRTKEGARAVAVTSAGELKVVTSGAGYEEYDVKTGTAADSYTSANTFTYSSAYSACLFLIESHDAVVSFRTSAGLWLGDIILPEGMHVIDIVNYGVRIKNRTAGQNATYQIVEWR